MPWMGEAAYCEPQMDDPGPGERRRGPAPTKVFRSLESLIKQARVMDELRTKAKLLPIEKKAGA